MRQHDHGQPTVIGWLGNILIVIGLYKLGHKWRHAFLFSIAGELCWMTKSYGHDWALCFICGVFCVMALRNWFLWRTV